MTQTAERGGTVENSVAAKVETLRLTRGWTYRQLSDALATAGCRLDPSSLHKLERATAEGKRRRITVDEAVAFADVFEVSIYALMGIVHKPSGSEVRADALASIRDDLIESARRLDSIAGVI